MKIKTFILYFSVAGFVCNSFGQNQNRIDSLLNVLKSVRADTGKVNTLNELGWELCGINPDTAIILAKQALSLSEKVTSKKHIADSYHQMALAYSVKGDYPTSLDNNYKALSIREELDDKSGIAKSLSNLGLVCTYLGDYPKSLDYYLKALKMHEELGAKDESATELGNIGLVYSYQSDYPKALDYYFKALKMDEQRGNKIGVAIWMSNIGIVYYEQKDYLKALEYYLKALKMSEELGDKQGIAIELGNIGVVYSKQGDHPKALRNYLKALQINEEIGNEHEIALWLGNIGLAYSEQKDYPKALEYYFKALKMSDQIGNKKLIALHLNNIGNHYSNTGKFAEAEVYLKKAIIISESIGATGDLWQFEKQLSHLYDTTGKYKLALEHYKKAMVLKDTLFNQGKNKEITRKEMNFEFEKTQAIEKAGHEKQLAVADIEIKKQKLLKNSFIGGLGLTILSFFFGYRSYRAGQVLRLQTIRNKISGDLHDDIGSTLNSISIYSEVAKKKDEHQDEALEMIGDASRKIIDAMSDIVWTINPENDSFDKIIFRMKSLAYNLFRAKQIEFTFQSDDILNEKKLSIEDRRNFYLIFKEAVNNLVKYSNATRATITLSSENDYIKLRIQDDGIGFDTSQDMEGNGLKNMKRRAEEMKAQFKLNSGKGSGTLIELILKA